MAKYGRDFTLLDLGLRKDIAVLRKLLGLDGNWEAPAQRLFDLVAPLCKSVIVEENYIDQDYRAEYAAAHYLRHHETPRRCTRVHFFGSPVTQAALKRLPEDVAKSYLGFCVVRPLPAFRLGRTVLSAGLEKQLAAGGEQVYLTCCARFRVNLAGNELSVWGGPWMQQDTLVSACASASLWVVNSYMAHRFPVDFRRYTTPEITEMATRYAIPTGRAVPSEGLTPEQIMNALRDMGFDPLPYTPRDYVDARNIAYRYIESRIPVIVGFFYPTGGHAVTMVGHTFEPTGKASSKKFQVTGGKDMRFIRTSQFAPAFIVQDDAGGPMRRMELIGWDEATKSKRITKADVKRLHFRFGCVVLLDRGSASEEVGFLDTFIVALPEGVTLDGYSAEERALSWVSAWLEFNNIDSPPTLVIRTFLELSNRLKLSWNETGMPHKLARELRRHLMSKWLWVTEIGTKASFQEGQVLGQVVLDSASHPSTDDAYDLLAFNMPGFLLLQRPDGGLLHPRVPVYEPYARFVRGED